MLITREVTTVRLSGRLLAAYLNGPNGASARTPWLVSIARWVIVHVAIGVGILAAVVLVLIHAARSHFPVVPFALVLLVALIASMYSDARHRRRRRMPRRRLTVHAKRPTRAA